MKDPLNLSPISRRALIATGAVAATLLGTQTEAADDKGPVRSFEGESKKGDLQDAIEAAVKNLSDALGDGGVADGQATWSLSHVMGVTGGLVAAKSVKVVIASHRTPPWKKS